MAILSGLTLVAFRALGLNTRIGSIDKPIAILTDGDDGGVAILAGLALDALLALRALDTLLALLTLFALGAVGHGEGGS